MHRSTTLLVTDYPSDIPATLRLTGQPFALLQSPSKLQESMLDHHPELAIVIVDVRLHLQQMLKFRQSLLDRKRAVPFLFALDEGQPTDLPSSLVLTRPVALHSLSKRLNESLQLVDSYRAYRSSSEYRHRLERLSERERSIAQMAANGISNRHMASRLDVSIKTIERQRQAAYAKLEVYDLAQLTRVVTLGNLDPILPTFESNDRTTGLRGLSREAS